MEGDRWPAAWWVLAGSRQLRSDRPLGVTRLGRRLVLWRDPDGRAIAAPAACPHRGTDLSLGRVREGQIVCRYHGFAYGSDGTCREIPCEGPLAKVPPRLRLAPVEVREVDGWIWGRLDDRATGEPPSLPGGGSDGFRELTWAVPLARAVEANIDFHHLPFAHTGVAPPGYTRLDPFDARFDPDGVLRAEGTLGPGDGRGWWFAAEVAPPSLIRLRLWSPRIVATVACTPVDADTTWIGLQYGVDVPAIGALPGMNRLAAEVALTAELWWVQPDDRRMVERAEGTGQLVHADKAIGLWHTWYERATRGADGAGEVRAAAGGAP